MFIYLFIYFNRRIQSQYDHLEQEYRQTCIGVLRSSNTRGCGKVKIYRYFVQPLGQNIYLSVYFIIHALQSSRSQPAIGLRQTPKARVSQNLFLKNIVRDIVKKWAQHYTVVNVTARWSPTAGKNSKERKFNSLSSLRSLSMRYAFHKSKSKHEKEQKIRTHASLKSPYLLLRTSKKKNLSVCLYTNSNIPFQILSSLYASFLTLSEDKTLTTTRTCFVYLILEMGKCQITKCPVACAHTHTLKRSTARERTLAVNINRKSV